MFEKFYFREELLVKMIFTIKLLLFNKNTKDLLFKRCLCRKIIFGVREDFIKSFFYLISDIKNLILEKLFRRDFFSREKTIDNIHSLEIALKI